MSTGRSSTKKPKSKKSVLSGRRPKMRTGLHPLLELPGRLPNFWSYSRYRSHRECARAYMLQHIRKIKPPESRAMERGTTIHLQAESYLKGKTKGLPDALNKFAKEFSNLKRLGAVAEGSWTLTFDEKHTQGDDFVRAWLRAKLDAKLKQGKHLLIVDFKTGRFKPDLAQMELYAGMSTHYEKFEEVTVELWFLDQYEVETHTWTFREAQELWKKWKKRGEDMLADREFRPSRNPKCDTCMYRTDKTMTNGETGPCEVWKAPA